jgi:ATP-dependent Clp protease ATP-binding subunit ClpB
LAERRITLNLSERAIEYFALNGYDPVYGARPLKRLIQKEVETSLAKKLISGEIQDGQSVLMDAVDGHLSLQVPN